MRIIKAISILMILMMAVPAYGSGLFNMEVKATGSTAQVQLDGSTAFSEENTDFGLTDTISLPAGKYTITVNQDNALINVATAGFAADTLHWGEATVEVGEGGAEVIAYEQGTQTAQQTAAIAAGMLVTIAIAGGIVYALSRNPDRGVGHQVHATGWN